MTTPQRHAPVSTDALDAVQRSARTFSAAVHAADIAEPLRSFDRSLAATDARAALGRWATGVAGVREDGLVAGFVTASDLENGGTCGDVMRAFEPADLVVRSAPLEVVLRSLGHRPQVFVRSCGTVAGVITWRDIEKPEGRMWLFGLVTALEMTLSGLVELCYADGSWRSWLSPGRIQKAEQLQQARNARPRGDSPVSLVDCLQLGDKVRILLASAETRDVLGIRSKESGEKMFRDFQALRDSLAHAQDLVDEDYRVIVALADRVDHILGFTSVFGTRRRT